MTLWRVDVLGREAGPSPALRMTSQLPAPFSHPWRLEPVAEVGYLLGPLVFGGDGWAWGVEVATFAKGGDRSLEGGCEGWLAAFEDGGPGGVEENVGDTGVAVEEDGDAALEAFDSGDAVALDGGHEEEVGGVVELLELLVGDETVKVDAACEAELVGEGLELGKLCAFAREVEAPVDVRGQRDGGMFEGGEGADDPVESLVGFDAGDGEHAELVGGEGAGVEGVRGGKEASHAGYGGFDAEGAAALRLEVVAGDDGDAARAEAVGDDAVAGCAEEAVPGGGGFGGVREEAGGIVHEGVEAAQPGEGGVEGWLVAGHEGFG